MPFHLWDRIRDWVILSLLLIISLVFMLARNDPMLRGLRRTSLEMTSWIEVRFAWVGQFIRAIDDNELLRLENIDFSSRLARSREARLENERLRRLLGLKEISDYDMVAARIITKDIFRRQNYLTLDVGRADRVDAGMAVVDEKGILGKVVEASEHYSLVMPYLNSDFHVPAKVLPLQVSGIVSWSPNRRAVLMLEHVVKTEPVAQGQLVVTSGYSGVFPPGYPIGRVDVVATPPGSNVWEILLTPAASLHTAEHAFVILQKPDPERLQLETRWSQ
ncbi:MAG: rod shape-determining protein MreC [Rhodothermales bacterium]